MKLLNNKSNRNAVGRLKSWLAANPEIPRFRQRVNKAAICKQASIARSTADANPEIRALLAGLNEKILAAQFPVATHVPDQKKTVPNVASPPSPECSWPRPNNRNSLALEHLLQTGRVVR